MNQYTIQIIAHEDVPSWTSLLNHNRLSSRFKSIDHSPGILNIDLTIVQKILPYHIVSLACLIEEYFLANFKIRFTTSENSAIFYLRKLNFFQYWTSGFNKKEYRPCEDGTSYCLWQVDKEMFYSYAHQAHIYYQRQFFKGRDFSPLNHSLIELFNNVIDHSQSAVSGYTFTQYFPNSKNFIISLCDFGLGIPSTVNNYLLKSGLSILTDLNALDKAFEKGFTIKSKKNNGGLGLDTISSIARSLESTLVVISNYAHLMQYPDGNYSKKELPQSFPGTIVVITLNTEKLNPLVLDEHNIFH